MDSNFILKIVDFFMFNEKSELNILFKDHSKKNTIFIFIFIKYFLILFIFLLSSIVQFNYEFLVENYMSETVYSNISFALIQYWIIVGGYLVSTLIGGNILLNKLAQNKEHNFIKDSKKYKEVYIEERFKYSKLINDMSLNPLIIIMTNVLIVSLASFYYKHGQTIDIEMIYIYLLIIVVSASVLSRRESKEYYGKVEIVDFVETIDDIENIKIIYYKDKKVYLNNYHYYLYDEDMNKYIKLKITTNGILDRFKAIYTSYMEKKMILEQSKQSYEAKQLTIEKSKPEKKSNQNKKKPKNKSKKKK